MKAAKIKSFTLKQKDFASGKMISPDRSEWKTCDCCGLKIVQGVQLSNGHHIGFDCEEIRSRVEMMEHLPRDINEEAAKMFALFGTKKKVQGYVMGLVS